MTRRSRRIRTILHTVVFAALALTSPRWAAAESFYKGKTVTIVVGEVPGGSMDAYARILATGLHRHLPDSPTVIVQNMPGAATVVAASYVANRAPKDGTVLLVALSTAPFARMFGNAGANYDATDFTYIGNFDQATDTCSVWKGSGVGSFDDLRKKPAIFGAVGPSGIASEYPRSMNALFGTKIKVIHGYRGTAALLLAMQRGEIQGACAFMESALKSNFNEFFSKGELIPIVQFARKSDDLKGVPYMLDLARSEEEKKLFNLLYTRDIIGRFIAAPPHLPPERAAMLRAAFDATVKDPEIIATMQKSGLPLTPMSGDKVEQFVRNYVSVPPDVLARANKLLEIGKVERLPEPPKK
jgi:tripartite-type tricarboxylate transporter receptor subunit TctC